MNQKTITFRGHTGTRQEIADALGMTVASLSTAISRERKKMVEQAQADQAMRGAGVANPPEPEVEYLEDEVKGEDGESYRQRKIEIGGATGQSMQSGDRIMVFNKLKTTVHCSDTILEPHAEGSILASDMANPLVSAKVVKL